MGGSGPVPRVIKAVLAGEGGVGKTSLHLAFRRREIGRVEMTKGFELFVVRLSDNTYVQVWDLSGQLEFRPLVKALFRGAHIVTFVFDVSRPHTLLALSEWIRMAAQYVGREPVYAILVANKIDLQKSVDDGLVKLVIDSLNRPPFKFVTYLETSALRGDNVDKLFTYIMSLAQKIVNAARNSRP